LNLLTMANLVQKRDRMRRIFRGHEAYGEGTAAEQANRYRLEVMYPDVVIEARKNSATVERRQVDLLVSLSGFSPETTLLAFELVEPRRLLVISSENTRPKVNIIHDKLRDRLAFADFQHVYVDPVDPVDIYDIVKRAVFGRRPDEAPIAAIIDITGGKKVMSAGAALAASQLDLPMCYIDSEFDPEMRQSVPGTERLCILPNPTTLFGDKDLDAAREMFRSGLFSGASVRFRELSMSMSEPARARFLGDLSAFYQAWCDLDTASLPECAEHLHSRLTDPRSGLRPETAQRLGAQLDFVATLVARDRCALLLNFFLLGEHYQQSLRYDFAALLYYRTIEESLSERLRRGYRGFDLEHPDYTLLNPDLEKLTARYQTATDKLFGGERRAALPWQVALIDALVLLHILDDDLLPLAKINGLPGIGHVRGLVRGRNRSILAHGDESVTVDQCQTLRARALLNLRAFWQLHHGDEDVDERIGTLRFVDEA
jgi:CRISPR-associated protein (Cas_Cas02710)